MALDATLTYDKKSDSIFGFEEKNLKFANHVLVFMLRGLQKKFKQPIAYYFCSGTTKTEDLVCYIKEIISAVQTTGLKIKATVCDQGCTNQAAINILIKERIHRCKTQNIEDRYMGFLINDEEIVPLFGPPHLLKCMRNNLLTKNLNFNYNGKNQTASWSHNETLYRLDKQNEIYELRTLPKLTESHVIPSKIKKIRVSVAAQIFSQRVASTMHLIANYDSDSSLSSSMGTSNLCLFMDKVFDSTNGSTINALDGKLLRCAVKNGSSHIQFWNEAIKVFKTMVFVSKVDGSAVRQPICVKNYIKTLESFKYLWLKLKSEGLKFLILRNINQDSLECFFGSIRSHGSRNNMPNCYHFSTSFKTLLLNNFSSLKSLGNCEVDDSVGALDILKQFLSGQNEIIGNDVSLNLGLNSFNVEFVKPNKSTVGEMTIGYVAGYIIRTLI
eukprot:XP_016657855.1 PREDICTED: uncharacterized protein LOC107883042 [Acyrthosiphon pisum]